MRTMIAITSMLVAAAATISLAPASQAAGQDGSADNNEFIFYFNSNQAGSISDFATNKQDLNGYNFLKSGVAGYGQVVKNNSASVTNLRGVPARVYENSGYLGLFDQVAAESSRNLDDTYNNNASFKW